MFPIKNSAPDVPVQVQDLEPTFLHLSLMLQYNVNLSCNMQPEKYKWVAALGIGTNCPNNFTARFNFYEK